MNKAKGFLFTAGIALGTAFVLSCQYLAMYEEDDVSSSSGRVSSSSGGGGGDGLSGSVKYGGQTYRTVQIGKQVWFAENLNEELEGSRCYKDDPAYCEKYGRLYDWSTAMTACPSGWHLPSYDAWDVMMAHIGDYSGKKLKATSGWNWNEYEDISGDGTDDYGFTALPGGFGYSSDYFTEAGYSGRWWTTEESSTSDFAYYRHIDYYYDEDTAWYGVKKSFLLSVRCLKN